MEDWYKNPDYECESSEWEIEDGTENESGKDYMEWLEGTGPRQPEKGPVDGEGERAVEPNESEQRVIIWMKAVSPEKWTWLGFDRAGWVLMDDRKYRICKREGLSNEEAKEVGLGPYVNEWVLRGSSFINYSTSYSILHFSGLRKKAS